MKVRYGQTGYLGARMSVRAARARREGKLPATDAAREWGFKSPAALRHVIRPCEWHHTGKFARATDFFDVEAAVREWRTADDVPQGLFEALTARGREIITELVREQLGPEWELRPTPKAPEPAGWEEIAREITRELKDRGALPGPLAACERTIAQAARQVAAGQRTFGDAVAEFAAKIL